MYDGVKINSFSKFQIFLYIIKYSSYNEVVEKKIRKKRRLIIINNLKKIGAQRTNRINKLLRNYIN